MDFYNSTGIYDNSTYDNFCLFQGNLSTKNITEGKYGDAIEFDAITDYMYCGNDPSLNVGEANGSNMTWELWVKLKAVPSTAMFVLDKAGPGSIYVASAGGTIQTDINYKSGNLETIVFGDLSDLGWHHIVLTHNPNQTIAYFDGRNITTKYQNASLLDSTQGLYLGAAWYGAFYGNLTVDEVKIYNRTLTPEEINATFNNGIYRLFNNFTSLGDGLYNYSAYAIDSSGNLNISAYRTVTVATNAAPNAPTGVVFNSTSVDQLNFTNETLAANFLCDDPDTADTLTYDIIFYKDGTANQSQVGISCSDPQYVEHLFYSLNTSKGDLWMFSVNVSDDDGAVSTLVFSENITIANAPPTDPTGVIFNSSIAAQTNYSNEDLTANFFCNDTDISDTLTYDIIFYKDGAANQSQVGISCSDPQYAQHTFNSGNTTGGDQWMFAVNVTDSDSNTTRLIFSNNITIQGLLNVSIENPVDNLNVNQSDTFSVDVTVVCKDGPCENVVGVVRYNESSATPDLEINTTYKGFPFFVQEPFGTLWVNQTDFIDVMPNGQATVNGIAFNGSDFWLTDRGDDFVYHYNSVGQNQTDGFDLLVSGNGDARDIVYNGTDFWIVDLSDAFVYHYNSSGHNQTDGFSTTPSGAGNPFGLVYNGSDFWIADQADFIIYRVDQNGNNLTGAFSTVSSGNSLPQTMAFNGSDFWVDDPFDAFIYHYNSSGQNQSDGFSYSKFESENIYSIGTDMIFPRDLPGRPITEFWLGENTEATWHIKLSNQLSCGNMSINEICRLNWTINVTGNIGDSYEIDVNFSSNQGYIQENNTEDRTVLITNPNSAPNDPIGVVFNSTSADQLNFTNETLAANFLCNDTDTGDTLTYDIIFYKDGTANQSQVGISCSNPQYIEHLFYSLNTTKGDLWMFSVNVSDDSGTTSSLVFSNNITITNAPPTDPTGVIFNSSIAAQTNYTNEDLTANFFCNDTDISDTLTYDIIFYKDGVANQSQVGISCSDPQYAQHTFDDVNTSEGDLWMFAVNITDSDSNTTNLIFSNNITINNATPSITWEDPTPNDGATVTNNFVYLNTTIIDIVDTSSQSNTSAFFDWNKTLLGYWAMDFYNETGIYDNSTYKNFAKFTDGLATSEIGKGVYGSGINLNSTNTYLNLSESIPVSQNITYMFWVYKEFSAAWHAVMGVDGNNGVFFFPSGSDIEIYVNGVKALESDSIGFNQWRHIAITDNGAQSIIYVDGAQNATTANRIGFNVSHIGTSDIPFGDHLNGSLDEVIIINRSLTPEEINATFSNGLYRLYNNFTNLGNGIYNYSAYAIDIDGNLNISTYRTVDVSANQVPNDPTGAIFNSSHADQTNYTGEDLTANFLCDDPDAVDTLTYDIIFYKNGEANQSQVGISCTDPQYVSHLFDSTNTTKGDQWMFSVNVSDDSGLTSTLVFSNNVTIQNTPPENASLLTPANGTTIDDRRPNFTWTNASDADGDAVTFRITIDDDFNYGSPIVNTTTTGTSFMPTTDLPTDNGDDIRYYWYVISTDGTDDNESGDWTFLINSTVSIILANDSYDFGTLNPLDNANTDSLTDGWAGMLLENDGNVFIDVNISILSDLWESVSAPTGFYQYRIDNYTLTAGAPPPDESGAFNWSGSITTYTDVPSANTTPIQDLNHSNETDAAEIHFNITVPANEPPGLKSSTLLFSAWFDE